MGVNSVCSVRLEEVFSCSDLGFRILTSRGSQIERSLYNWRAINCLKTPLCDSIAFASSGRVQIFVVDQK